MERVAKVLQFAIIVERRRLWLLRPQSSKELDFLGGRAQTSCV